MNCPLCKCDTASPQIKFTLTGARTRQKTRAAAILELLIIAGPQGLTVQELAQAIGAPQAAISARITELSNAHAVVSHGVRLTRWRRKAHVWAVPQPFRAEHVEMET